MKWLKENFIDSKYLVIVFGSFVEGREDIFEWNRSLEKLSKIEKFSCLYVKDPTNSFWHGRFEGLGYGVHLLADHIKNIAEKSKAEKVLTIGLSMGGYGALTFACLCNFDYSVAISPQSYLSKFRYKKNRLEEKYKGLNIDTKETDVKYLIENYGSQKNKYYIYYGERNKTDKEMAERLKIFPNVYMNPLNSDKHTVVGLMRDKGMINKIIFDFVRDKL